MDKGLTATIKTALFFIFVNLLSFFAVLIQKDRGTGPCEVLATRRCGC